LNDYKFVLQESIRAIAHHVTKILKLMPTLLNQLPRQGVLVINVL